MKKIIVSLLVGAALLSGCSTFANSHLEAAGAKASGFCVEGSGPPMTGEGTVAGGKVNDDFKGTVSIKCGESLVVIESE